MGKVVQRMSTRAQGVRRPQPQLGQDRPPDGGTGSAGQIHQHDHLSEATSALPLNTHPIHGVATRVIITEYDLPRPRAMPHDAIVDTAGRFGTGFWRAHVGRLDPKTGKAKEFPFP
jgi:hypothetical protein